MKIYLFLENHIVSFSLPEVVSGSFSFDENPNEEAKLINIEARDGKWILYSTEDVHLKMQTSMLGSTPVEGDTYYVLTRNNKDYIIYVCDIKNIGVFTYTYTDVVDLKIGNTPDCNIQFDFNLFNGLVATIHYDNKNVSIQNNSNLNIYVNDIRLGVPNYIVNIGDQLNIYGLNIMFLKGLILICASKNKLKISSASFLSYRTFEDEKPLNIKAKDKELYTPEMYFSKSPRIRRIIETKEIKLADAPNTRDSDELPPILTIGPMVTMALSSVSMSMSTIIQLMNGSASFAQSWPSLMMSLAMLISMLVWPALTSKYNKKQQEKKKKEMTQKYHEYLGRKEKELIEESNRQREILFENLVTLDDCMKMIMNKQFPFWNKRVDQNDFLVARIGMGNPKLDVKLDDPDDGFAFDETELEEAVKDLRKKYKNIKDAPLGYSFYRNPFTAIMGERNKCIAFVNNIVLQLISFYSYEDLKFVIFTDETSEYYWDYLRYTNHNFSNDRTFRFFASSEETYKTVLNYMEYELANRKNQGPKDSDDPPYTPYYLIIIDDYRVIRKYDFIRKLTEEKDNYGFSVIFIENRLSRLPSKCSNFITIGERTSGVLKNAYEKQEQETFLDEVKPNINMMAISKIVANIPIEFESGGEMSKLPESISFMEMEKVGKVEQLNIANRWRMNDSTQSLKAEVGVNAQGDLIYLDLHEKAHGPHGLIAGTTGSGKSEFIITYILSMAINYSPEDAAFILIDYKGGGLAFAFENKATGKILPHLAGTITNLDKAEMDRTLVSIDSELKRRQTMFNTARDELGESTIDIYKYQRFYHEGRLKEPIPHLFIVCDEFAELKTQQPDFMDSLISAARIGRSLGVHLILATQKPSGVVTDQIWSNTKFRVCLKVQDAADSKDMLKKPDAAALKEAGRFYLQVGYDELYVLGQSGWCGAKYYPSERVVKTVDKSVNFLNDCGQFIKSIQASSPQKKGEAQGEQIAAIMDSVIDIAKMNDVKARKLWLDNIPAIILEDDIETKYNIVPEEYNVEAIIGEYDAPEKQEQGLVKYNLIEQGNTIIYGNDSQERELLLSTIIYSTVKSHSPEEINYYIFDYGSESLRIYDSLPHFGGAVYNGEDEKYNNLFKLIREEISNRKALFADYGGEYKNYIKTSGKKLPIVVVILNNYDALNESDANLFEEMPTITRDSDRYGVIFILTANQANSVRSKEANNFKNLYAFKLKDNYDYQSLFNTKSKTVPRSTDGRGVLFNGNLHEFQTCHIVEDDLKLNDFLMEFVKKTKAKYTTKAKQIPTLPSKVRLDNVKEYITSLREIPIGIYKATIEPVLYDFVEDGTTMVIGNKIEYTDVFIKSLIIILRQLKNTNLLIIDAEKSLNLNRDVFPNYYTEKFDDVLSSVTKYLNDLISNKQTSNVVIVINCLEKLVKKIDNKDILSTFFSTVKKDERFILITTAGATKIKSLTIEPWFTSSFNLSSGIWLNNGIQDQQILKFSNYSRDQTKKIGPEMGYVDVESNVTLFKIIDFITPDEEGDGNE